MRISREALDEVIAHARAAAPQECCGILLGTDEAITIVCPARNVTDPADAERRFEIDPREHFAARRLARQNGLRVVAFYHSHPRGPEHPSATDVDDAMYPDVLTMIVSLASDTPRARLFRIEGGRVDDVPLES